MHTQLSLLGQFTPASLLCTQLWLPTQEKRTCKIMQEFCKNLACKSCLAHARDMSLYLHNLAQEMVQDFARVNCCKNNYLHFLHIFCKILQELVQDCARIVQEKEQYRVHVLHARFLQDSCTILHDLASSFLLGSGRAEQSMSLVSVPAHWTSSNQI